MVKCSVLKCKNTNETASKDVTFHKFPEDEADRVLWVMACGRQDWKPPRDAVVCSIHFHQAFFKLVGNEKTLFKGALPTRHIYVCRICLCTDRELYNMNDDSFRTVFTQLTGFMMSASSMHQLVCWECRARLANVAEFREKAIQANHMLSKLLDSDPCYLTKIPNERKTYNLTSKLETQNFAPNHADLILKHEYGNRTIKPNISQKTPFKIIPNDHKPLIGGDRKTFKRKIHNIDSTISVNDKTKLNINASVSDKTKSKAASVSDNTKTMAKDEPQVKQPYLVVWSNSEDINIEVATDYNSNTKIKNEPTPVINLVDNTTVRVNSNSDEDIRKENTISVKNENLKPVLGEGRSLLQLQSSRNTIDVVSKPNKKTSPSNDNYGMPSSLTGGDDIFKLSHNSEDMDDDARYWETEYLSMSNEDLAAIGEYKMSDAVTKDHDYVEVNTNKSKNKGSNDGVEKDRAVEEDGKQIDGSRTKKCGNKKTKKLKENQPKKKVRNIKPPSKHRQDWKSKIFSVEELSVEQQIMEYQNRKLSKAYISANYKCNSCYIVIRNEDSYNRHIMLHSDKAGLHECEICKKRFKTKYLCQQHKKRHTKKYTCKLCNLVTSSKKVAEAHERYHDGVKYTCPYCDEVYKYKVSLFGHLRIQHKTDIICELCGFGFLNQRGIYLHRTFKHRFDNLQVPPDGPTCDTCQMQFLNQKAFDRHLKESSKHVGLFKEFKYRRPLRYGGKRMKTKPEPITCEQCGEKLPNFKAYHQHFTYEHPGFSRSQYSIGPYTCMCEICGRFFQNSTYLADHKLSHTGKQFKCGQCGKCFPRRLSLLKHEKYHDDTIQKYPCKVCGREFTFTSNLIRHMRTHSDDRPHKCDICEKLFKTIGEKRSHTMYVHMKKPWPKRDRGTRQKNAKQEVEDSD